MFRHAASNRSPQFDVVYRWGVIVAHANSLPVGSTRLARHDRQPEGNTTVDVWPIEFVSLEISNLKPETKRRTVEATRGSSAVSFLRGVDFFRFRSSWGRTGCFRREAPQCNSPSVRSGNEVSTRSGSDGVRPDMSGSVTRGPPRCWKPTARSYSARQDWTGREGPQFELAADLAVRLHE